MYTDFAEVYDTLMSDVNYSGWADFYIAMMRAYGLRDGSRICECACGTGNLTIPLAKRGFRMTGVDLSQEMLFQASTKARAAGLGIPFVRQDMRNLRMHRPMDAVLATCDGVNYLLEDYDVSSFFSAAFEAVRPGGGLFFDVSTPYKLSQALGDRLIGYDSENITYLWQNQWHERTGIVDLQLCIFVKNPDGSYRRMDEKQRQKAHTVRTLTALLQQAGFSQISVFGDGRLDSPRETEQRWHFAAMRPVELEA